MTTPLPLPALRGEVHRFRGVVDRFGRFECDGSTEHTICIRDLHLAGSQRPIATDHWWFRLREVWVRAGVRQGDTVLFTAQVQRCTKGWGSPGERAQPVKPAGPGLRRQVVGFGTCPRSVLVLRERTGDRRLSPSPPSRLAAELAEARSDLTRAMEHRDALLRDTERLQETLAQRRELQDRLALEQTLLRHALGRLEQGRSRLQRGAVAAVLAALALGGVAGAWLAPRWNPAQPSQVIR